MAGLSAMRFSPSDQNAADPIDRESDKPDFQGLIYPGNLNRLEITKNSPPAFIAGGYKDGPDISEGMARLYLKFKEVNVPAELHIYANMGHGFGIRKSNQGAVTLWPEEFRLWLSDMGFLVGKSVVAGNK